MIIKNYNNISGAYIIDSGKSGKTAAVFGGIHGDEISGINATNQFLQELRESKIILEYGKIILVTVCNYEAANINKREVKYNLNRLFHNLDKGNSYEENRSKELMSILEKSDYLLDLHSTSEASIPFTFAEEETLDFAKEIGVSHIVTGWENFEDSVGGSTEQYMNSIGGKGYTYEAGSHLDIDGTKNAYKTLLNFLTTLGMIHKKYFTKINELNIFNIEEVYVCKSGNFEYSIDNLSNFSEIKKDTCIGIDGNENIIASEDKILFMPKTQSIIKKGEEVFFYVSKK